jgi:7,8-dihydropterin-6-yl-methyl-4-(beta-D-ribofuranosyl)aminobenzene 5'-phosphate synthase
MKKSIWLICLVIFLSIPIVSFAKQISIIYDSDARPGSRMKTGWGFSAIIERGDFVVMLDTGWDEKIFKHNLNISGYKPTDIDIVVISHWHPDHTGGLKYLMEANPNLIAYVPGSTDHHPPSDKRYIIPKGKKDLLHGVVVLQTTAVDSEKSGVEDELSVVVKTAKGPVVVHGCAHSELRNILKNVKKVFPGKIHMSMGGMRYLNKTEDEMRVIVKDLKEIGLEKIGPAHCAVGPASTKIFNESFGKDVFYARLEAVIPLPPE